MAGKPLALGDLFGSPDHYLHAFDGDAAVFVPMDRAAYHRSIFLDARISPADEGVMRVPLAMLAGAVPLPSQPTGWIFHVAHCGSTLLARALDVPAANLVLREPLALRQLAVAQVLEGVRLPMVAAMLSKRYRPALPTIVKANVPVNFLLPQIGALDPAARALLLYLPLREYLLAILRSDEHRQWLRRVTGLLAPSLGAMEGWPDAERGAALWLAQMSAFAAAATRPGARSLDAERFFAEPRAVLAAAAAHLRVPLSAAAIDAVVGGPLFAQYSKNPAVPFDTAARLARQSAAERALAGELDQAARWIAARAQAAAAATAALARVALLG